MIQLRWETRRSSVIFAIAFLIATSIWALCPVPWPPTWWLMFAAMEFEYLGIFVASGQRARKHGTSA